MRDPLLTAKSTGDSEGSGSEGTVRVGVIDSRHLLLVGAEPGLGLVVAHRFASGGYRVTLVARSTDRLGELASRLAATGAEINTIAADARGLQPDSQDN
jgi:NAD(P)-dependent dehydrogenase (short-subunit alcohol dehydrogenase family)